MLLLAAQPGGARSLARHPYIPKGPGDQESLTPTPPSYSSTLKTQETDNFTRAQGAIPTVSPNSELHSRPWPAPPAPQTLLILKGGLRQSLPAL
ncbi:hypothetical protein HispidOSU_023431 [Sigmodon hispidus]